MTTTKRRAPLRVEPAAEPPAPEAARRADRFSEGVRSLRIGTASVVLSERILLVLGGVIAPLGLVAVLLGWWGAARTPNLFEQVPYLISGGLLGLGLVFLGSFLYFAHWLTQLVQEHRTQSAALLQAIERLHDRLPAEPAPLVRALERAPAVGNGHHGDDLAAPEAALVATERGSMAHRPDCVVVAGKPGVRPVGRGDGHRPCKLCEPW